MRALSDGNVLLALCYAKHEYHAKALVWLNAIRIAGGVVVCRSNCLGLLRLLTTPAVMGKHVCSADEAWKLADRLLADSRFAFWNEPAGIEGELRRLTEGGSINPKVWQDAYLAAFAITAGLSMVTFDRGFARFRGLTLSLVS